VNHLRVMEWDGTDWAQVGSDFPWNSYRKALAVGPDGNPYVAYDEPSEADGLKVARWDGNQWILLDDHVTPSVDIWSVDMKFAPDGTLYVAYHDGDNGYITNVKRWTGSAWEQLGNDGIEVMNTGWQSLAFGGGDTVYVSFVELDLSSYLK